MDCSSKHCPSNYLKADGKDLFLFGARWTFGAWLLYLGASKWVGGASAFVAFIEGGFSATWVPALLVTALGWIILIAEPLLGLLLMIGCKQRLVWLMTANLCSFS